MEISAVDSIRTPPSSFAPKAEAIEASVVAPTSDGGQQNARYFSPYIQFDHELGLAIIQYRNADTGAVVRQVPSKQAVDEYRARSSGRDMPGSGVPDRAPAGSEGGEAVPSLDGSGGLSPLGSSPPASAATGLTQAKAAGQPKGGGTPDTTA